LWELFLEMFFKFLFEMNSYSILGAGPSGLSAAINLAKEGYHVDVYEKNNEVGARFNGDLQGLENWSGKEDVLLSLTRMNIETNFDYSPFTKLSLTDSKKYWNFSLNRPAFYLLKRGTMVGSLDQSLKEQAMNLGVEIHFRKTIPKEKASIIATGPIAGEISAIAKGIIFKTNINNTALAILNNNAAFRGYSYLLVTDGYGTLCTVIFDRFHHLKNCFIQTKKMFLDLLDLNIENPRGCGGVGCFSNKNQFIIGKKLYVGEAAGLQDLLWGFGIRSAITSGFLAAKAIINNEDYAELARRHFEKKIKSSVVNRYLWEKIGQYNYSWIVNRIESANDPLKYLYSFHNYNAFQKLAYPMALRYLRKRYKKLRL
jgi:flavin-dependent dehydrogenase